MPQPPAPVPGGPAQVVELTDATLRVLCVGELENDAYLLTSRRTGAQILVDAAAEPDRLLAMIAEGSPASRLDLVVTTHRHDDHLGALAEVLAATGARHAAGGPDAEAVARAAHASVPEPLHHGQVLTVADLRLEVLALRGHTPGAVALALIDPDPAGLRTHLFTGDSLFPGGPGRTESPADFDSLMTDLEQRVFDRFDDTCVVWPGHGRSTTLGDERPQLAQWRDRGW